MQDQASIAEQIASFHRAARENDRHERNLRVAAKILLALIVFGIGGVFFVVGTGVGVLIGGLR